MNFFNVIKSKLFSQSFFKNANITSIWKKKGSKQELDNQRGIFGLSAFKKILRNLIYNDIYQDIDNQMSDSNIGGRKKLMAKDHLFILYGIINDIVHGDAEEADVIVMDLEKAFDKLWLIDTLNDVTDSLPEAKINDKVALLYESNKKSRVAIKTPYGLTERTEIEEVVEQGGCFGCILCSNSIDKLGKKSLIRKQTYILSRTP